MRTNPIFAWTIPAVLLVGMIVGVMTAAGQKTTANSSDGKQWLTALDTDHDGTVSKQEFTAYMQAQFDKADADHDGTLDASELEQLRKSLAIATNQ